MNPVRFDVQGYTLRLGDADTPAPEGVIDAREHARVIVALAPFAPKARGALFIRKNGGEPGMVPMQPLGGRRDKEMLFEASLGPQAEGDELEYWVLVDIDAPGRRGSIHIDSSKVDGGRRKVVVRDLEAARARVPISPAIEIREAIGADVLATAAPAAGPAAFAGGFAIRGPVVRISKRLSFPERPGRHRPNGPRDRNDDGPSNGDNTPLKNYKLSGTVALEYGAPAAETSLRLYEVGFGGTKTLLTEAKTAADGSYELSYAPKTFANVEVYAVGADGAEVPLSTTLFNAAPTESADLIAPSALKTPEPEFARLTAAISPYLDSEPALLKNAVEMEGQRDFTFLATATGWDGRALALASEAYLVAERTSMPPDGVYAMARAGLPLEPQTLALVPEKTVADALRVATEAGIVAADAAARTLEAFKEFAADVRFTTKLPGTLASAKDFVEVASFRPNEQRAFTEVVRAGLGDDLWARAKEAGVSDATIEQLQMQGKLAYLTFNNAQLSSRLAPDVGSDPMKLVSLGYYDAATWKRTLRDDLAGGDAGKLDTLIPPAFTGRTVDERLDAYADELARRVRQMDPHAVTVERIAKGDIDAVPERELVKTFLAKAVPDGFRLGGTPLSSFVADKPAALEAVAEDKRSAVLDSLRTLSSLYAVSPSDEVMSALLKAGFKSSLSIARYDARTLAELLKNYVGERVVSTEITKEVVFKAQQQSATVFNVFSGLKRLATTPYAPGASGVDMKQRDDQLAKTVEKLKGLYPTVENLFGSVDYCECEECQSVLSPAAYLVDILHFLDPNDEEWALQKAAYKVRTGADYPKAREPFDALNARRPDLKNIALTCENTNTALPYIDLANEIMEQLVAESTELEAFDTGEANTEDLIAEPQHITWAAYVGDGNGTKGLRDLVYPVSLPFDLPLEMVRAFLGRLELPLWQLRERITRPANLDGWRAVWFERLGLGDRDVEVLTRSDRWWELYGYRAENDALDELTDAKTLSRRLDVTYKELVELVRTRFINPGIDAVVAIRRLGVDPGTVDRYFEGALTQPERAELEEILKTHGVEPDDLKPMRDDSIRKATVELRSPSVGCDFAETKLAFDKDPADVDKAMAFTLLKMNAFVRLKKKLGWETHELDCALVALTPGIDKLSATSWSKAITTALTYFAHVEELRERFGDRVSREELCILWSDIPFAGIDSLYERLFLSPAVLGHKEAFEFLLGAVLKDKKQKIADYTDVIRQAFQLAHDEIEPIFEAAGAADRVLSIKNLSILMRYSVLARGLDVSISDLLSLLQLSERKPLSRLEAHALGNLAKDVPWSETLAFVREIELAREAGTDVAFLARICRHVGVPEEPANDPAVLALQSLTDHREVVLVQALAAQLSAPEPLIDTLVRTVLKDEANKPLLETGFADHASTRAAIRKLRRALDLIRSLDVTEPELAAVLKDGAALSPNALPMKDAVSDLDAKAKYKGLRPWFELVALRRRFGRSERVLAVLSAGTRDALLDALEALTGLARTSLDSALAALGTPALTTARALRELLDAFWCFTRLGLDPKDIVIWAKASIDEKVAEKVRASVKGRYTPSSWRRVAQPIFDVLRKKQRDALVAHLTHVMDGDTPKYGDTMERLFEHLLLDPGMEPVVLASRIQLAISSVQLFVQRCLMNLEHDEVDAQIIDANRWEWMRRYRVWEVNRKMFLWAENWLDPEFRDDKSHLYRTLESKLLQGDVNDDLVREGLYAYLKGLEEIARLEMLTMYFDPGVSADAGTIHVVGRTPTIPHKYFYRRASHGMWTPWEPLEMGIEGEHVVLASWRGRMHLFWVSFLEQARPNNNTLPTVSTGTSVDLNTLKSTPTVQLQLHWIEQVHGKWVHRSSTPAFVDAPAFDGMKATTDEDKRKFFARAVVVENLPGAEDDDLEIHITAADNTAGKAGSTAGHRFVFFSKLAAPRSESVGTRPKAVPYNATEIASTKWKGTGGLSVKFTSQVVQTDGVYGDRTASMHSILTGGSGYKLLLPSTDSLPVPLRTPPVAVGRPAGFAFRPQGAHHVVYRTSDGSIANLQWTNGWHYENLSSNVASVASDGIEPAASDPHGYALDDRGIACVAYAGATKLHELVWSPGGWRAEVLYTGSDEDRPVGQPLGGVFADRRGVVFRTRGGKLIAAVEPRSGSTWDVRVLNDGAPKAKSNPTGLVMAKTELGVTTVVSRHVFYVGDDGNVHELRSNTAGAAWTHVNITGGMPNVVRPADGANPSAYAFLGQNTLHVVYRGTDSRIHELWGPPGAWNYSAIGASSPLAVGDPSGYVTENYGTQHVVYRGEGDRMIELWWGGGWKTFVLANQDGALASGAPPVMSDPYGYQFADPARQHVVYLDATGQPTELWEDAAGWHRGRYELENPFPDEIAPLAAPFFYEAERADHTFFVEPYVIETAVHEWTEWIVTTKEYVVPELPPIQITPIFPERIPVVPSDLSIIVKQPIDPIDPNIFVKTSKGVFGPAGDPVPTLIMDQPLESKLDGLSQPGPMIFDINKTGLASRPIDFNRFASIGRLL